MVPLMIPMMILAGRRIGMDDTLVPIAPEASSKGTIWLGKVTCCGRFVRIMGVRR